MAIVASRRVRMVRRLSMTVLPKKCRAGQGLARKDAAAPCSGAKCARIWRGTADGRADGAGRAMGRDGHGVGAVATSSARALEYHLY
ncbi:hypothetical protein GCM10011572_01850 [Pseudoduganella buxea]|uniref:Uncharacterized protein n=1 Tax=Pseudoduganella buxea TaxID=1949069 RepID=A0ABQ1JZU8_9BURK|nr:hypothetical protein GCM10011572_01850 [Pseudoduganella buxea]